MQRRELTPPTLPILPTLAEIPLNLPSQQSIDNDGYIDPDMILTNSKETHLTQEREAPT